jgi:hypothetical protein
MATEKITIQIGDEVQELKGAEKEAFIAQREADAIERAARIDLVEAEQSAKRDARESAIKKLGEIAGLTKEELDAIL